MGIIAKQTIKGSVYTYAGAIIGFVNAGLLMPKFLSVEQVGLINLLIALTLVFSQLGNLGFAGAITRLFPYFRDDKKKHNGILTLGILISSAGFIISYTVFVFVRKYLVISNYEVSSLLSENIFYIPILSFFVIFFYLLDNYNKVLFDAVTGTFLREFLVRFLDLILIIAFIFDYVDFNVFVLFYVIIYALPSVILFFILIKRKVLYLVRINSELIISLKHELIKISLFWIIAGFAGVAVQAIDKYMTNFYLGLGASGIYAVSFFFGVLVSLPARPMRKISSVIIAEAWKKDDRKTISEIYKKSSINMFLISVLLVAGIWINIDNIFEILPKYSEGKYVILFISLLSMVDMSSGTAITIIANSKHYRINAYVMVFTLLMIVITNVIFINLWGLKGAAFASLISISASVFIRFLFLYKKFKFQPYTVKHVIILLIAIISLAINYLIPKFADFYIDILIRSSVTAILFSGLIYFFKVSEEVNKTVNRIIKRVKK